MKASVHWLIASCFFLLVRAALGHVAQCTEGNTWGALCYLLKITCTGPANLSTRSTVQSCMSFLLGVEGSLFPILLHIPYYSEVCVFS